MNLSLVIPGSERNTVITLFLSECSANGNAPTPFSDASIHGVAKQNEVGDGSDLFRRGRGKKTPCTPNDAHGRKAGANPPRSHFHGDDGILVAPAVVGWRRRSVRLTGLASSIPGRKAGLPEA